MPSNKWVNAVLTVVLFLAVLLAIGAGSLALAVYLRTSGLVPTREYDGERPDLDASVLPISCAVVVAAAAAAGAICFQWWRQSRRED